MITHCYNNENKKIMGVTDFNCKKGYSELVFDAFGDNHARGEARFFTSYEILSRYLIYYVEILNILKLERTYTIITH